MGLIDRILVLLLGGPRNVIKETAEVFRENSEQEAVRESMRQSAALGQFGAEFNRSHKGGFDRFMDGVNRVPRPALALGILGLFVAAMIDPVWFSERMQGVALVPEPLWWLLGIIVSFYFGARHQAKGQEFQSQIAQSMGHVPQVVGNIRTLRKLRAEDAGMAETGTDASLTLDVLQTEENAALAAWKATQR